VNTPLDKVAILGVGLIGGSLAAAGRQAGLWKESVGLGRNRANLDRAVADGIIDEATTDPEYAVSGASLIVLAAPVDTCMDELLPVVAAHASADAVVTDVGSVKAAVVAAAEQAGLGRRFVGAHPMAGGTSTGAAAADASLFDGCVVAITPGAHSALPAIELVERVWSAVGAQTVRLGADDHDRSVAATSHLAQVVAYALAAAVERVDTVVELERLAGPGLRDTTRIAAGDVAMWGPILHANRDNLLAVLDSFETAWKQLRCAIADDDAEALAGVVADAHALRRRLTKS